MRIADLVFAVFSIIPTLIEVVMVLTILAVKFDLWYAWHHGGGARPVYRLDGRGDRVAHQVPPG
jgi:hypothetical protein